MFSKQVSIDFRASVVIFTPGTIGHFKSFPRRSVFMVTCVFLFGKKVSYLYDSQGASLLSVPVILHVHWEL